MPSYYDQLIKQSNDFAELHDLDAAAAFDLRNLLLEIAKHEYKEGNKSGIKWASKKPPHSSCIFNHDHQSDSANCVSHN